MPLPPRARRRLGAGLLASTLLGGAPGVAATVVVTPVKDNTLYEDLFGTSSNGAGRYLFAGRTDVGSIRRALIAFDVAAAVPPGSTVDSVTLTLAMSRTITGPSVVSLHRLLADWGEAGSRAPMGEGIGAPAEQGDATWIFSSFDTVLWSTPGGDFEPTASAERVVDGPGTYSWGSTIELVADVQRWVDDPVSDFGWILLGDETTTSAKRFDSRDHGEPGAVPRLTVVFTPDPTAIPTGGTTSRSISILLLAGLATWVLLRRR